MRKQKYIAEDVQPNINPSINLFYSNNAMPYEINNTDILSVNYYDSYINLPTGLSNSVISSYGYQSTNNVKGLPTVSKIKILGTSDWITSVIYYDEETRPVYIYKRNEYLKITDIIEQKYDFIGRAIEVKNTHKKDGNSDLITINRYTYDNQGRLVEESQKINNNISERIVRNNYNDLGKLTSKLTGNGAQKGYKDQTSGITLSNDLITKTSTNGWNEGLATKGVFQVDGYVEYEISQANKAIMVGLSDSNSNTNAHYNTIDFAIYTTSGSRLYVYESGSNKGNITDYQIGDKLKIERIGNKVYYKKNGTVFYISQKTSSGSLSGDVSMYHTGAKIKNLHIVDNSKGLQNVDYDYNVRGWLTNINDVDVIGQDLFTFKINYNITAMSGSTALFNGNISETIWNTQNDQLNHSSIYSRGYSYKYDALNRITKGEYKVENASGAYNTLLYNYYNLENVSYDKNGNILQLKRRSNTSYYPIDDLTYTYDNGNKLLKVLDNANPAYKDEGFKDNGSNTNDYAYDANGNMVNDTNKAIVGITYNHLNLPVKVPIIHGNSGNVQYIYDATGVKQKKITTVYYPYTTTITEYADNYIYENGQLQFFSHAEGYVKYDQSSQNFDYVYQYKDHLGNVRLTYADNDNSGDIDPTTEAIEESNYYPFGLKHGGYNNAISPNGNSTAQKYKFNGKELEQFLGLNLYEMDVRNYDPAIARWIQVDPVLHYSMSPYVAFDNNPIFWSDPSGADAESYQDDPNLDAYYDEEDGKWYIWNEEDQRWEEAKNVLDEVVVEALLSEFAKDFWDNYEEEYDDSDGYWSLEADDIYGMFDPGKDNGTYKTTNGETKRYKDSKGRYIDDKKLSQNGRQHKLQSKVFSGIKKANVVITVVSEGNNLVKAYKADGNQVGYNTKVQAGETAGRLAGAWAGAKTGALIGTAIAGPLGGFIGGLIGGGVGAWIGGDAGKAAAKAIIEED